MATSSETSETSWVGTSLADMYHGHGPWDFPITPIVASRHHAVLYELPATLKKPPEPHYSVNTYHWDDNFVRMPYSTKNLFPVQNENGEKILKERWELIRMAFSRPIKSSHDLETAINFYNTRLPKFLALHYFFEHVVEEEESQLFFDYLLPEIIHLALKLPEIVPGNLPLLRQGSSKSISLSQHQIACLMANAFLCTFPWRKDIATNYPGVNFARLFGAHLRPKREQAVAEKLKCIFHYFRRVIFEVPVGVVTFERKYLSHSQLPSWSNLDNNMSNTKIHISNTGVIEDGDGFLQVDFANKNVGGGVLSFGCVQEEIRFIICPELIISRLFTEQLGPTEALIVTGVERFSNYTGYGDTFEWLDDYRDRTPFDNFGRRRTSIAAIDAVHFGKPIEQYVSSNVQRELNKAYVGFHSRLDGKLAPVATGNWGCGAFNGNPKLKFLIQLMACSVVRRNMVYFTFGDVELRDDLHKIYLFLATNHVSIGQLWKYICQFYQSKLESKHLLSYIQQAHFDSKQQLSIKKFFSFNKKSSDKTSPSTSKAGPVHSNSDMDSGLDIINPSQPDSKETCSDSDLVTESSQGDSDIIESSQNEPTNKEAFDVLNLYKKHADSSSKTELTKCEDIFNVIEEIDGEYKTPRTSKATAGNDSFLSMLDQHTEKLKTKDVVITIPEEENLSDSMDTGQIGNNINKSNLPNKPKESAVKRKITDYFTKMEEG